MLWLILLNIESDLFKHGLVEPATLLRCGLPVEFIGTTEELEYELQSFREQGAIVLAGLDQSLRIRYFTADLGLTQLQIFNRHCLDEIGVEQLLLLPTEPQQALALVSQERIAVLAVFMEGVKGMTADVCNCLGREVHLARPQPLDGRFNLLFGQIWQLARFAAGVSPQTEEVGVDPTLTFGRTIADPATAALTAQAAF